MSTKKSNQLTDAEAGNLYRLDQAETVCQLSNIYRGDRAGFEQALAQCFDDRGKLIPWSAIRIARNF